MQAKTNDVSFYEYMDSIRFEEARKKQDEFLKKLSNIKIGKKNHQTKRFH